MQIYGKITKCILLLLFKHLSKNKELVILILGSRLTISKPQKKKENKTNTKIDSQQIIPIPYLKKNKRKKQIETKIQIQTIIIL